MKCKCLIINEELQIAGLAFKKLKFLSKSSHRETEKFCACLGNHSAEVRLEEEKVFNLL